MKTLFSGLALEIAENTSKTDGKTYHKLIGYEFGVYGYNTQQINLKPEQVAQARSLVGKKCEIICDIFVTKTGFHVQNFCEGRVLP